MTADRSMCCEDWPKPCPYHEGWQDAVDAMGGMGLDRIRLAIAAARSIRVYISGQVSGQLVTEQSATPADFDAPAADRAAATCVCASTSARNCPIHGNGGSSGD